MHVCTYPSFESLPPGYTRLFDQQPRGDLFSSRIWNENNATHGIEATETLCLYGVEEVNSGAVPLALFVAYTSRHYPAHRKALVVNFPSSEGALFVPVTRRVNAPSVRPLLERIVSEMRNSSEPHDVLRFGPPDSGSDLYGELIEVLRDTGQIVQSHHIYTNRYATTAGISFHDFLRGRSAKFRQNLNRRQRNLEQSGRVRYQLVTGGEGLESAISDCARILATCWRDPELDPVEYIASIIRASAEAGALRLGMLHIDKQPVAYALCVVSGGTASFLRIAHHERFKRQSVGSAVIYRVVEHILDVDRVRELILGRGTSYTRNTGLRSAASDWGSLPSIPVRCVDCKRSFVTSGGERQSVASNDRVVYWGRSHPDSLSRHSGFRCPDYEMLPSSHSSRSQWLCWSKGLALVSQALDEPPWSKF